MAKIYTRTGDRGESSLYNGDRLPKTDPIFQLLGQLDSLNAQIGIACSYDLPLAAQLQPEWQQIQKKLLAISAEVAQAQTVRDQVIADDTTKLEQKIDIYMEKTPKLTNLILPGGSHLGAHLHYIRTTTRQTERYFCQLQKQPENKAIKPYLNRLSDYFFACARYVNHQLDHPEPIWSD